MRMHLAHIGRSCATGSRGRESNHYFTDWHSERYALAHD